MTVVNKITATVHDDYALLLPEMEKVRDCSEGSQAVKRKNYTYLPHPSQINKTSPEQQQRYIEYKNGAEFPDYVASTKKTLLGKMRVNSSSIELPDSIEYLTEDSDGDGMSAYSAMEHSCGEVLEVKYHFLVADYQGLTDVDTSSVSIADIERINPRATIKQYSRESLINWHASRINGKMQFDYLEFIEHGTEFDKATGTSTEVQSCLILALDADGNYYQQKRVYGKDGVQDGEPSPVLVGGLPLKWLPISIATDEPMPAGVLSKKLGFLHQLSDLAIHSYNTSAVYKETIRAMVPTKHTSGWKDGDFDLFKQINGDRDYAITGGYGINNYPEGIETGVTSCAAELGGIQWALDRNDKQAASLSGESDSMVQMSATEAAIVAAEQNALLESLASGVEQAWAMQFLYCGMFEGLWSQDDIEANMDQITVSIPRSFSKPKLSVDEVRTVMELQSGNHISRKELIRQLEQGCWLLADAEEMMKEIEEQAPNIV